jgi:hypothetical protein
MNSPATSAISGTIDCGTGTRLPGLLGHLQNQKKSVSHSFANLNDEDFLVI